MMKKKIDIRGNFNFSKYYQFLFIATLLIIILLFQVSFSPLEALLYDFRAKYDFGFSSTNNIVLVTMDEESEEFLGEKYPYTYATHERLMKKLSRDNPLVINYLVNLSKTEFEVDILNIPKFKKSIKNYIALGGHFRFATSLDLYWGEELPPYELREFGYSLSSLSPDKKTFAKDDVLRRAVINSSGESSLHLWTANTFRTEQLKSFPLEEQNIHGAYYSRQDDTSYALFRYPTNPTAENPKIPKIPFHQVIAGNFHKGFFTNKIVLVGPNYISKPSDYSLTPFAPEEYKTPNLMAHAAIIDALIQNKTVYIIPKIVSYILTILIAIFLSTIILKIRPKIRFYAILFTSTLVGVIFVSHLLFSIFGLWLYTSFLLVPIFVVPYLWMPFKAIIEYRARFVIEEETTLLKKVEDLKRNFISLMSHDLKTPVARIAAQAEIMLKQSEQSSESVKNLNSIISSTKELNRFITSILNLTEIESKSISIHKVSKDVNPIIESVVGELKYEASSKNINIKTSLDPLYPIEIDIHLIKRVLSNLIENAIKYSKENTQIEITSTDDEKYVYISIKDTGVGISPQDLQHIFDKFYRVKNDANYTIKGTGLGLYLVKYFIELHGGNIDVNSTPDLGTTFEIKLINH